MVKGGPSLNPAGKPPGTLARLTVAAKEAIERCYEYMGADDAFGEWAKANPTEFYVHLFSKLIPKDIHVTGTIGVAQLLIEAGNLMKTIEHPATPALEHVPLVVIDPVAQNVESVSRIVDAIPSKVQDPVPYASPPSIPAPSGPGLGQGNPQT